MNNTQKLFVQVGADIPLSTSPKVSFHQHTLGDILDFGYDVHNLYIASLIEGVDDMLKALSDTEFYMDLYENRHKLTKLDMILIFSKLDDAYSQLIPDALNHFLRGCKVYYEEGSDRLLIIFSDEDVIVLTADIMDEIIYLVKYCNSLINSDGEYDPHDEKTRELIERMKKYREKVEKIKNGNEESGQPLYNVISAITVRSNSINKMNILDLTIFQIYDEYKRLITIDQYNQSLQALMAGASGVELQQWDVLI